MEQMISWNTWKKEYDTSDIRKIDAEIKSVSDDQNIPFVEKHIKLGYLYYSKDYLAVATSYFEAIIEELVKQKNNKSFVRENENGLNILFMGFRVQPDGCGGWEIIETGCCGSACGPICCCLGIASVMACFGISANDVTTCDTTDGQGCFDNCLNSCCGWCESCGGC